MHHQRFWVSGYFMDKDPKYAWLREALAPLKSRFAEILLHSFFINLLALAVPLFSLQVYDRVIGHRGLTTLMALAIGVVLALAFDFLLRQARSRLLQSTAVHIDAQLGRMLYTRFASLPLTTLETRPAQHWRGLFQDAQIIRTVFSGPSAMLLADLPFALIFLAVVFMIASPIAWALLAILTAFLALTWHSTRSLGQAATGEARKSHSHDSFIAELLAGRLTVKSLMLDHLLQPRWEHLQAEAIEESWWQGVRTDQALALGQSLSTATTVILVSLGALAIIDQQMTMGALIATTMLASRIIAPFNQLLMQWRSFTRCRQAIHHLDELQKLPQEMPFPALERPQPQGHLIVENLGFTHAGSERPLLTQCNLALHPGEIVGLVGRNGCGKSTLLKLLQGLYTPSSGRILLDGADLAQYSRSELSRWIGYIPQECFLFNGSIRDNITKAWPEADDASILAAAQISGAEAFINELPEGYHTQIGENGSRLSGGQRQRLAIARALLRNPPILLMDEITSNLDTETETKLRNHLLALAPGHTILLATHSLVLLRACHRILALDHGHIIADGPAETMLARMTKRAA